MQEAIADSVSIHPGAVQPSPKKYSTAVILSAVFGFVGVQHFYLGRLSEGLLDLGLTFAWLYCFATAQFLLGAAFLIADIVHALAVTIMLLTGNFRDGGGHVVCYPGQRLDVKRG
jgi:TM2 domain-containing membrane protein YozV